MIVGKGLIATRFMDYYSLSEDVLLFASGVSNSLEINEDEFLREFELVRNKSTENLSKLFIYFSTTSLHDPITKKSPYVLHKARIERYLIDHVPHFLIVRLSQVFGAGGNSNNLINRFLDMIVNGEKIYINEYATRNIVDIRDVGRMVKCVVDSKKFINNAVNVASPWNVSVLKILKVLEKYTGKEAKIELVDNGAPLNISIKDILDLGYEFECNNFEEYLMNSLNYWDVKKYIGNKEF